MTLLMVTVLLVPMPLRAAESAGLAAIHATVQQKFGSVRHLDIDQFKALAKQPLVVFDVRAQEEYAVSHLANAILVDPDVDKQQFMKRFAKIIAGKRVVFYCSVGYRSSSLAQRLSQSLKDAGATGVDNLRGGIFHWHNQQEPLVDAQGPTDFVHPYSRRWGKHVVRRDQIRFEPRGGNR